VRVVIVGSGIMGLSSAYNLAKLGVKDIVILEKEYLSYGSTVRSASRFRVHFWTEENSKFAIESKKIMVKLSSITGWNMIITTGGYLWLLFTEEQVKAFREKNKMWERLGIPGEFLSPSEIKEKYPYIYTDDVLEGFFGPQNGSCFHNYVAFGYYKAAAKLGAKLFERSPVERVLVENNKVVGVMLPNGKVEADVVLLTAGAWTDELLRGLGIELPTEPERKEMALTESYKYFIEPLVIDFGTSAYVGQALKGEILGSIEVPVKSGLLPLENTLDFLVKWAKAVYKRFPVLRGAKIMRCWSGYYSMSADSSHIMGRDPDWPEGLYVAYGDSGHGFMMGPLIGKLLAKNILYGEVDELMRPFLPTRFKEGKLVPEKLVIG
jgi:sarcosine oxidase subunit beta